MPVSAHTFLLGAVIGTLPLDRAAPAARNGGEGVKSEKLKDGECSGPRIKLQGAAQAVDPFEKHIPYGSQ